LQGLSPLDAGPFARRCGGGAAHMALEARFREAHADSALASLVVDTLHDADAIQAQDTAAIDGIVEFDHEAQGLTDFEVTVGDDAGAAGTDVRRDDGSAIQRYANFGFDAVVLTHVGHRELLTRTGTSDNNHSVKRVAPISK